MSSHDGVDNQTQIGAVMEMESIQGYIDRASDLLDRGNLSEAMNLYKDRKSVV